MATKISSSNNTDYTHIMLPSPLPTPFPRNPENLRLKKYSVPTGFAATSTNAKQNSF